MGRRLPPARVEVVPFHKIMPGVAAGRYDAGLVIHEARFTSRATACAPWRPGRVVGGGDRPTDSLGAILANRGRVDADAAAGWIRDSVRHAWAHPGDSRDYVLKHAQEMEVDVVDQHIGLYVNEFTEDLGDEGYRAVDTLLRRAAALPAGSRS